MMSALADTSLTAQEVLLSHLQTKALFSHEVSRFELLQTHISWVLLTGPYAYKFKKPVDLGFLDFSTLALRKHFCEEELRLNQRLAPQLYLDVVSINGDTSHPHINGTGPVIEYAVKMRQFPQSAQLDKVLARHELTPTHIDSLADAVANFHHDTAQAGPDSPYGDPDSVLQPVMENFAHIRQIHSLAEYEPRLQAIKDWCQSRFTQLKELFVLRKAQGFIREGHGDMHLRNMALLEDRVVLFDCLEFNPALRWVDTINDIAFLLMDLDDRHQGPLAWRFLNRYLQHNGDYDGLRLLDYYKVYRALVRAKVDAIRLAQSHLTKQEQQQTRDDFLGYLSLAESYIQTPRPVLVITRGLSGSGKTTYSQSLLESLGAIRLRSDVERKRQFAAAGDLYDKTVTQQVYQHLHDLAALLLQAGYSVIVDATFLDSAHIQPMHTLATHMGIPFHILEFNASPDTLRRRISQRAAEYSDADLTVLEKQLQHWHALPAKMQTSLIQVDTEQDIDLEQLINKLKDD